MLGTLVRVAGRWHGQQAARLISANGNCIRAAARRGGMQWLAAQEPDALCLQEVRAADDQLREALASRDSCRRSVSRFETWFAAGEWVDVHRAAHGPGPGPCTWWSWRGQAFDNDSGWRIGYQLASRPLADRARAARAGRAAAYDQRWSDHAPVTVDYDLG
jgi:exonuclease III